MTNTETFRTLLNKKLRDGEIDFETASKIHAAIDTNFCQQDVGDEFWLTVLQQIGFREGELVTDFHERLKKKHKCSRCENYGNNGCGSWIIEGIEFRADQTPPDDELVESIESVNNDWKCYYFNREDYDKADLVRLRQQVKDGTLIFSAAIQEALRLMPESFAKNCYGDIVRSAAAVACHRAKEAE